MSADNSTGFDPEFFRAVAAVNIVSSTLSVIGALSIIWCSFSKHKVLKPGVLPLFHLALADLIASLLQMVSSIVALNTHAFLDASIYVTGTTAGVFMSTYLLTSMYALEAFLRLWYKVRSPYNHREIERSISKPYMFILYGFSWVIPVVGSIVIDTQKHYKDNCTCLYDISWYPIFHFYHKKEWRCLEDWETWRFLHCALILCALVLVIFCNATLYFGLNALVKRLSRQTGIRQRRQESKILTKTLQYQVIFCVCWTPTIILAISCLIDDSMDHMNAVYILQAIFAPLQGFLNSIFYGWYRRGFVWTIMENTRLMSNLASDINDETRYKSLSFN